MIELNDKLFIPRRGVPMPIAGRAPDHDSGDDDRTVWNGPTDMIPWPEAAQTTTVVSSSPEDAQGGAGCRRVRIVGLDANGDLLFEDIAVTGLTPLLTRLPFYRIFWVVNTDHQQNDGIITINHGATVLAQMDIGRGISESCAFTVPRGWGLDLNTVVLGSTSNKELEFTLWIRLPGGAPMIQSATISNDQSIVVPLDPAFQLPSMTDLWLTCRGNKNNQVTAATIIASVQ